MYSILHDHTCKNLNYVFWSDIWFCDVIVGVVQLEVSFGNLNVRAFLLEVWFGDLIVRASSTGGWQMAFQLSAAILYQIHFSGSC